MSLLQTLRFSIRTARLGEVPHWNPRRVNRLARWRLRRLVRIAVARSPYYREKYRGIDPGHFRLDQLPPSTKEELRGEFDGAVTDRAVRRGAVERFIADPANLGRWFQGRYAVSHTSGSQGPPMLIVQDRRCLEILFGMMSSRANIGAKAGPVEGLRRLRSPARVAIVAQRRGFYPSGAAFEFMPEIVGPFVSVRWLSAMQADLLDQLNDFQPNTVVGYASVLEALALQSADLALGSLRQIANSSEQLTPRARARIQSAFGVPLLDHYGTGECLLLSEGCPTDGGAHVNADWAILEVVDDAYRPVVDGQLGTKVLITNLANTVQPFIRYEIGDRLAMAIGTCRCGSRLPRIACIDGRAAELFWVRKQQGYGMVPGVLFHNAVDSLREIREWQAIQHARDRIEIRLEPLPGAAFETHEMRASLERRLRQSGLPEHVAVEIHIVSRLTADASTGKFRRMISHVGMPEHALFGNIRSGAA